MTREMIGGREQEAFQSRGFRGEVLDQGRIFCGSEKIIGGHEFSGFQVAGDFEHSLAFAHGERLFENLAIGELPKNVVSGSGPIEKIFAGFQRTTRMTASVKFKGDGAADGAFPLEQACYAPTR